MRLLLLIAALAAPPLLVAEETVWYDVEVIIFAQPGRGDIQSEGWPDKSGRPDSGDAVRLDAGTVQTVAGRFIPLAAERLTDVRQRLERNGYPVIAHTAWRQPGLARERALPVAVETDTLAGTLRLTLSRFLHLEARLAYAPEGWGTNFGDGTNTTFPWESVVTVYPLNEERRMRSRELHYLDNPVFGVIATVWPYEPPAPVAEPVETPPAAEETPQEIQADEPAPAGSAD